MGIWNEVAPRYHKKWAGPGAGAFGCTGEMLRMVGVGPGSAVLDVACGTGAVTFRLAEVVGEQGRVVGVDASMTALGLAKNAACSAASSSVDFVNADAETVKFGGLFDAATCQFGVFFFPDAPAALQNIRRLIKRDGRLGVVVHGKDTPYHTCFTEEVERFIPNYFEPGMPAMDRYSSKQSLGELVAGAGFVGIQIRDATYRYSPGDFASYWNGYVEYVAEPYRKKIENLPGAVRERMRRAVQKRALPYTKNGTVEFPWQVLILTATV